MKEKIRKFLKRLCDWRFLVCFGLAWIITNGWAYIFIGVGSFCDIGWMLAVGTAYVAFLWMPFTLEKLITIPLAILLLKLLFPKSKQLQEELKKEKQELLETKKKKK